MDEPCELLPWDTEFFGITIARVKPQVLTEALARRIDEWCRDQRVRCLYYTPSAEDAWASSDVARQNGYELMDVKLTLEHDQVLNRPARTPRNTIRPATHADVAMLEEIAAASHRGGRFERDPGFGVERAVELYRTWIRKSVMGGNEHVIVAEADGKAAGYSVCKMSANDNVIWLVAVDERARGKGIGTDLVHAALDFFAAQGKPVVRVVTQAENVAAQRLYQRCGFVTRSCTFTYHKWFEAGSERG